MKHAWRRHLLATTALLLATGACAPPVPPPGVAPGRGMRLLERVEEAATVAGIGRLRENTLPAGDSEIRVWVIPTNGLSPRDPMLRLRSAAAGAVHGELFFYNASASDSNLDWALPRSDETCANVMRGDRAVTCIARFRAPPDWKGIREQLADAHVETLPDEDSLPPAEELMHKTCLVVEVRDAGTYRAYHYCEAQSRDDPHGADVRKIMQIVHDIDADHRENRPR